MVASGLFYRITAFYVFLSGNLVANLLTCHQALQDDCYKENPLEKKRISSKEEMAHAFGLATYKRGNTSSICLLQSCRKLMLLASEPWMVYDFLLSGRTFKIPEGKYLASIISSVCSTVG